MRDLQIIAITALLGAAVLAGFGIALATVLAALG